MQSIVLISIPIERSSSAQNDKISRAILREWNSKGRSNRSLTAILDWSWSLIECWFQFLFSRGDSRLRLRRTKNANFPRSKRTYVSKLIWHICFDWPRHLIHSTPASGCNNTKYVNWIRHCHHTNWAEFDRTSCSNNSRSHQTIRGLFSILYLFFSIYW